MSEIQSTGYKDKNNKEIFNNDTIRGKSIEGEIKNFTVKWSDYHKDWIANNPDEIYDISSKIFEQYEVV
jgi:hypothetical protein